MSATAQRYFLSTYGCRVNQADAAALAHGFGQQDMVAVFDVKIADLIILNTCTVTHRSDADVRKELSRIQRLNPEARVIVTGCYAQRAPEEVAKLPGVDLVVGNSHKARLPILSQNTETAHVIHTPYAEIGGELDHSIEPVATAFDHTRPFVKIQDGCDAVCTYCIIPEVRGPARSTQPQLILEIIRDLIQQGYFEIVITGVHLGTYGQHLTPQTSLFELLTEILALPGLGRLRLGSIEPMSFDPRIITLAEKHPHFAPHFHLPLQSGSDTVLKRMVRPYRADDYYAIFKTLREKLPHVCIGTDVIVGFPGETEAEFSESLAFIERCAFDYLHIFSYSERKGTAATKLPAKVNPRHIQERSQILHKLGAKLWHHFLDRQIGQSLPAVVLRSHPDRLDQRQALSANYCPIDFIEPTTRTHAADLHDPIRVGGPVQLEVLVREGERLRGQIL